MRHHGAARPESSRSFSLAPTATALPLWVLDDSWAIRRLVVTCRAHRVSKGWLAVYDSGKAVG